MHFNGGTIWLLRLRRNRGELHCIPALRSTDCNLDRSVSYETGEVRPDL